MYGLLERDLKYISKAMDKYEEIERAILFGSRAMGNYKKGSDIDIALVGNRVTIKTIRRLSSSLNEEYPLPYFFDIINYNDISNEDLKKHIDKIGKLIYKKQ